MHAVVEVVGNQGPRHAEAEAADQSQSENEKRERLRWPCRRRRWRDDTRIWCGNILLLLRLLGALQEHAHQLAARRHVLFEFARLDLRRVRPAELFLPLLGLLCQFAVTAE